MGFTPIQFDFINQEVNYAPIAPQVLPGVKIRNIDPVVSLQSMTYYLSGEGEI